MLSENALSFQKYYVISRHFINVIFAKYNMLINKKRYYDLSKKYKFISKIIADLSQKSGYENKNIFFLISKFKKKN